MKIPFDIKYRPQIESGKYKVETSEGRKVRIICWDMVNASYSDIVALVESPVSGNETIIHYYQNGQCVSDSARVGKKDLVIITPEPKLTKFEQCMSEFVDKRDEYEYDSTNVCELNNRVVELIHTYSAKLLSIAKKELADEFINEYNKGYERGKREDHTEGYNKAMRDYNESVTFHYTEKSLHPYVNPNLKSFDDVKLTTSDSSNPSNLEAHNDGKELLYVAEKSFERGKKEGLRLAKEGMPK